LHQNGRPAGSCSRRWQCRQVAIPTFWHTLLHPCQSRPRIIGIVHFRRLDRHAIAVSRHQAQSRKHCLKVRQQRTIGDHIISTDCSQDARPMLDDQAVSEAEHVIRVRHDANMP